MESAYAQQLRELLASSELVRRTSEFAARLHPRGADPGTLLLVGTPAEEPWHLAAHLDDEARLCGVPQLSPTLVRWAPPPGAPAHLSVGLQRIDAARRGETLFVVAPDATPERLLEAVADARRGGATVLAMDVGDAELGALAHDRLVVPIAPEPPALAAPPIGGSPSSAFLDMEVMQHLVSLSAGETTVRPSLRGRLARLLDRMSGPAPYR